MALQPTEDHSISAWREYDETVAALRDSMSLGNWALTPGTRVSADDLFAAGARRVTFHEVVDTDNADAAATVRVLTLIRDLTACGIVVGWELRSAVGQDWRELSHLYPPASVIVDGGPDGADPQAEWARGYLMTKCVARRGPGLLQVRDRRFGNLRKITIVRPDYLAAIAALEYGAPAGYVSVGILRELRAQRLVGMAGDIAWWLPYRLRRYAFAPRVI